MADPFAVPADVQSFMSRPLTSDELDRAAALLTAASAIVRSRLPSLDIWIADGLVDPELAKFVVVSMVARMFRNPEGYRQVTKQVGSFQTSVTMDSSQSTGGLYLGADELALLWPASLAGGSVGTIQTYGLVEVDCELPRASESVWSR